MASRSKKKTTRGPRPTRAVMSALVEAVSTQVLDRIKKEVPSRDAVRELRRDVQRIVTRLERVSADRPRRGRPPSNRKCTVKGCNEKHVAHGFCSKHYQHWRRAQQAKAVRKK